MLSATRGMAPRIRRLPSLKQEAQLLALCDLSRYFGAECSAYLKQEAQQPKRKNLMELLANILFAFAMNFTAPLYGASPPETDDDRRERIGMIAEVDADVASAGVSQFAPGDAAALLLAIQLHESALDYYVHAGLESPIGHQDHGKARCLGQIHTWPGNPHLPTKTDHMALAGLDREATTRCATVMLKYLWGHAQRCIRRSVPAASRWETALTDAEVAMIAAAYGAGYCSPVKASNRSRARTFRRIRKQMTK